MPEARLARAGAAFAGGGAFLGGHLAGGLRRNLPSLRRGAAIGLTYAGSPQTEESRVISPPVDHAQRGMSGRSRWGAARDERFAHAVRRRVVSVVEDVPADCASTPLVVEDELPNFRRDPFSLPVSFGDARSLSLTACRGVRSGCPDRICRSAQVVGGDVGHCRCLPSRERGVLCGFGQVTAGGIRRECGPAGVTHAHLAAHPGTTDVDSVTRAGVVWLGLLKQMQDVLCAEGCPLRQQPVVFVRQRSAAAHSDQSGVTVGGQDRHELML
jgi:hypothetical protein